MDSCLLLYDTALRVLSIRFGMLAYYIYSFYDDTILVSEDFEDLSGLTFIVAGVHKNGVSFFDMKLFHDAYRLKDLRCQ